MGAPEKKVGSTGPLVHLVIAIVFAVISGCLVFMSFPLFNLFPLQWISLVPLLIAVNGRTPAAAWWLGFITGWITNIGGFYWVSDLLQEFGHMAKWLSVSLMVLLAAYQGLTFAISTWLGAIASKRLPWAFSFPIIFTAVEYLVPFIFPWYFANGQQRFYAITQVVEITGVSGLTFLLVFVNCAVAEVFVCRLRKKAFPWVTVGFATLLFAADIVYGVRRIAEVDQQVADAKKMKIGIVEADVGIWEKEAKNPDGTPLDVAGQVRMIYKNLLKHQYLTANLLKQEPDLDLVIWPESSYVPLRSVFARRMDATIVAVTRSGHVAFVGSSGVLDGFPDMASMRVSGLRGVAAAHEAFVIAVGLRGAAYIFDGMSWKRENTPTDRDLLAVAVSPDGSEAMAVGMQGTALVRRGGVWKAVELGTRVDLTGVAWTSDIGFVVCGDKGFLAAFKNRPVTIKSGTEADLLSISWSEEVGVVAVGADGVALRIRSGNVVEPISTETKARLLKVAAGLPTFVLEEGGRILICRAEDCKPGPHVDRGVIDLASDGENELWIGDRSGRIFRLTKGLEQIGKLDGQISAIAFIPMREGYPLPRDLAWVHVSKSGLPEGGLEDLELALKNDARTPDRDRNAAIRGFSVPLLFGAITYTETEEKRHYYNSAILVAPDGKVLGRYDKNFLLIFGEYIPFSNWFPFLKKWLPEAGDFIAGESVDVFDLKGIRLGVMICYEDIIPSFTRKLVGKEPNVLLNITNDAWFGKTAEPYLHLQLATFRAIENRLFLLRSTNTGVSAVIDPVGRILQETSLDNMETIAAEVAVLSTDTIYRRYGDVFAWICCGLSVVFVALARRAKR